MEEQHCYKYRQVDVAFLFLVSVKVTNKVIKHIDLYDTNKTISLESEYIILL